ncbi:VOC family protein [Archangium violaceum]|uniref:SMU1112c/YaeR family gloxylase I-like metalloprotein n=1 Tax=Archangium violaceum TaxID=83451 RepID=UPI00193C03F1|nr:VOC family protein [Archangium violaceum]QRK08862.1 VOC family protein [Archangium violaceum]
MKPLFDSVHHVALICSDYARSKAFYTEILGLPIIREVHRVERSSFKLDLQVGPGVQLELFSFPHPPPRPTRPEACGLRHLAFAVADIDPVIAHLRAHGIETEEVRVDPHTGQRFTFFRDPDDLPLEIYETERETIAA